MKAEYIVWGLVIAGIGVLAYLSYKQAMAMQSVANSIDAPSASVSGAVDSVMALVSGLADDLLNPDDEMGGWEDVTDPSLEAD